MQLLVPDSPRQLSQVLLLVASSPVLAEYCALRNWLASNCLSLESLELRVHPKNHHLPLILPTYSFLLYS